MSAVFTMLLHERVLKYANLTVLIGMPALVSVARIAWAGKAPGSLSRQEDHF